MSAIQPCLTCVCHAGRKDNKSGRYWSLSDMEVPSELQDLFAEGLSEGAFRLDISSTQLREQLQQQEEEGPHPPPPTASSCTPPTITRCPTEDVAC